MNLVFFAALFAAQETVPEVPVVVEGWQVERPATASWAQPISAADAWAKPGAGSANWSTQTPSEAVWE